MSFAQQLVAANINNLPSGYTFQTIPVFTTSSTTLQSTGSCMSSDGKHMYFSMNTVGVYHSSDYGQTWEALPTTIKTFGAMDCSPDGATVFAHTGSGLLMSTDYGQTWTTFNSSSSAYPRIFLTSDLKSLFTVNGLYKYDVAAKTYKTITLSGAGSLINDYAVSADGNTILWAPNSGKLYMSTDGGTTTAAVSLPGSGSWKSVVMSPDGLGMYVYNSTSGLEWGSFDGGQTWASSSTGIKSAYGAWAADGKTIVYGNSTFTYSFNKGQTWVAASFKPGVNFYTISISDDGKYVFAPTRSGGIWLGTKS